MPKSKPKAFKRKGTFEWKKNQTQLTCNGVPVANVLIDEDELLSTTYYSVDYMDKEVKPGKYGFASKEKAIAHIVKRFNLS